MSTSPLRVLPPAWSLSALIAITLLLLAIAPREVHAQLCPAAGGAAGGAAEGAESALSEIDAETRLSFILSEGQSGAEADMIWAGGWALTYFGLTVGQLATLPLLEEAGDRIDIGVGAASSAIGLLLAILVPPTLLLDYERLTALRRSFFHDPRLGAAGRCALLAQAEAMMLAQAEGEEMGSGILAHIGNVVFNVAIGLVLGLGYGRWESAGISAGTGVVVGAAVLFTQPSPMSDALRRYRAGTLTPDVGSTLRLNPASNAGGFGISLGGRF